MAQDVPRHKTLPNNLNPLHQNPADSPASYITGHRLHRLIKHHPMKIYMRVEVQLHVLLTLALDGGEWSASCPGCFTPEKIVPSCHWIGGWVGSRPNLDAVEMSWTLLGVEPWFPGYPACGLVTILTELSQTTFHENWVIWWARTDKQTAPS
jgi:hypothetical protein